MKKTVILGILTITLGIGGVETALMAAETEGMRKEVKVGLTGEDLTMKSENLAIGKLPTALRSVAANNANKIYRDEGASGARVEITAIDIQQRQMGVRILQQGDWQIRRIVAAYWDFEQGKTEKMADDELETLGEEESATWKVLWDYDAEGATGIYQYVEGLPLEENLTDIVYYAVEFGHETGAGWDDIWWEKGKVNYRGCADFEGFNASDMFCTRGSNRRLEAVWRNYTPVDTTGKRVVAWDEEWGGVLRQRYQSAMGKLEGLRYNLNNVETILEAAQGTLAGLEVTLPKATGMYDQSWLTTEVARLQGVAKGIKVGYEKMSGAADQAEIQRLKEENEKLERAEKETAEKYAAMERENADLREKLEKMTLGEQEKSNAGDEAKEVEMTAEVREAENGVVRSYEMGQAAKVESIAENTTEAEKVTTEEDEAGAEVPNLGKTERNEAETAGWLAPVTGVSALGAVGLGVGRKLKDRRKVR